VPVDRNSLPKDPEIFQQMLVDLTSQLDKTQRLLAQLLAAKSGTRSEQLSADQLRLFTQELAQELGAEPPNPAKEAETASRQDDDLPRGSGSGSGDENQVRPRTAFTAVASEARAHRARSDGRRKTLRILRTGERGPVRVVSRRPLPHRSAFEPAPRRTATPPLGRGSNGKLTLSDYLQPDCRY